VELNYLLDTNIVLYHLGGKLREPLPGQIHRFFCNRDRAVVLPDLTEADEMVIRDFPGKIHIVGLTQEIKDRTISLRRGARLKTPDALIAATAIIYDTCVLTNDTQFQRIGELRCKALPIK